MKKIVLIVICTILVYIYIHNPNLKALGGMGVIKFLYPICLVGFVLNYRWCISLFKTFKREMIALLLLFLFSLFRAVLGGDLTIAYTHLIMFLEVFFIPLIFISYLSRKNLDFDCFIRIILITSAAAAIITTLCLVLPSFGNYVRYSLLYIKQGDYLFDTEYRGFGISDALTSSYGYIQGFCFALGIHYSKNNKWYLFFLPFVFLSTILNARTGVIVTAVGVLIHLLFCKNKVKYLFSFLLVSVALVFIIPILFNMLNLSNESMVFITSFFDDLTNIYEAYNFTESDTTSNMVESMIFWPEDLSQWIIGRGVSVFGGEKNLNSDIGYINQINYGGLIYVFLILKLFFAIIKRMYKYNVDKFFIYSFIFISLLLNFKTSFFTNVGIFRLFILIYFAICYFIFIQRKYGVNIHISRRV